MTVLSMWEKTSDFTATQGIPVLSLTSPAIPKRSHCMMSLATVGIRTMSPGLLSASLRAVSKSFCSPPDMTSASVRSSLSRP